MNKEQLEAVNILQDKFNKAYIFMKEKKCKLYFETFLREINKAARQYLKEYKIEVSIKLDKGEIKIILTERLNYFYKNNESFDLFSLEYESFKNITETFVDEIKDIRLIKTYKKDCFGFYFNNFHK